MTTHSEHVSAPSLQKKRALLEQLLSQSAKAKPTALSYGQKALYFLHRSDPDSAAYHVAFTARFRSEVNVAALRRALQGLVDRHEQLRARFLLKDGEPVQEIAAPGPVTLVHVDASGWSDEQLDTSVQEAYRQPFDLEHGPVFRGHLFSLAGDHHVLLITVHHIVYDAWSLWLNQDELAALYAAETGGATALLPRSEKSYQDFIKWQSEFLSSAEGERLWKYWEDQLRGEVPTLNLPTDHPRPPVRSTHGASRKFSLRPERVEQLRSLAQARGVTPFMLYLAVFQVLLHRYTGQEDILVGSPSAGRNTGDYSNVVGYFVNPLVFRAALSGNPRFTAFLEQVRDTVLGALEHQDFPFPLLVERLQPKRDPSYSPLFQVSFVHQKSQRAEGILNLVTDAVQAARTTFGGLEVEHYDMPQQEGQFDLELEMIESGIGVTGIFKYNTDLFDHSTIERAVGHFETLLDGILENPSLPVGQLPLLPNTERDRMLVAFNDTAEAYDLDRPMYQFIEEQVERTPDAIALTFGEYHLSYRELNKQSNRLANYLRGRGIGRDALVAVCMDRSPDMLVALLGILKAGGAYLPLDPALPAERLSFMLEDATPTLILVRTGCIEALPQTSIPVLPLDASRDMLAGFCPDNPKHQARAGHLAYVIYTSGSTGKPKGVQIEHGALTSFLYAMRKALPIGRDDSLLAVTTLSFDIAVLELYLPLTVGARVLLAGRDDTTNGERLLKLLEHATFLQATPSTWQMLLRAGWESSPGLHMLCGGEALPPDLAAQMLSRGKTLWNMYGPTETTVWSTMARVADAGDINIGQPILNTQIYILDKSGQPTAIGVPGELHIGGWNVARGYLNRAELTAERFIADPFSKEPNARIYKTGDLARWREDGVLEHLGRLDFQVKIRGFRIELGEIEQNLCEYPDVTQAVVVTRNAPSGDLCLVGYVTGPVVTSEISEQLRGFLKERLPDYFVPTALVVLDRLPLNHNGKVDRSALPMPELWSTGGERTIVEPRDALEKTLTSIWEEVLGMHPVGILDNFFDLGGHSLRAIRLMADIQKVLDVSLPLSTLFKAPTVEQLANIIRQERPADSAWSPLVPIQTGGDKPPVFFVAGGGGSVLYFQPLSRYLGADQPFYGLQSKGLDGESVPFDRVEDMAACYVDAIRSVRPKGPYRLGGHCFGAVVAFEIAQQLIRDGDEVDLLTVLNVPAPRAQRPDAGHGLDYAAWVVKLGRLLEQSSGQSLDLDYEEIKLLDKEAQLEHLKNRMNKAGFLPPEAGVGPVRGLVEVLKTNGSIEYFPEAPVPVPIALLRAGKYHPEYDFSGAEYPTPGEHDETLGWQAYASGPVIMRTVPGDHITMLSEPNVTELAASVDALLSGHREAAVKADASHLEWAGQAAVKEIELRAAEEADAESPWQKNSAANDLPAPGKSYRGKQGAVGAYADWLLRRRYLVIVMVLLLVSLAAAGISRLHFENDYRMFFSKDNPELIAFDDLQNTYTQNDNILIVLAPKDGAVFTGDNLSLVENVTAKAWKIPYSTRVDSLTNFQYSRGDGDVLAVEDLVKNATGLKASEIDNIKKIALADPLLVRRLISPSGRVTAINVIVQRPGKNQMNETKEVTDFVRHAIKERIEAERPDVNVYLTGNVMMDAAFADASEHDGQILTPLMSGIIVVALLWFLRSFVGTLVTVTVIALSILTALGLAGWLGIALSPSSVPAPTILLTLAVADSVHMLMSYYDGARKGLDKHCAMKASLRLNLAAVFFTSLTTAISFLSMNFSDAPPFRDLGNITAMGVIAAFVLSMTLLPVLTVLFPAPKLRKVSEQPAGLMWLAELVIRRRKAWYLAVLVLTGVSISFVTRNELNDEFVKYFATGTDFRDATDFTTDNLTGIYSIDYSLGASVSGGATDPAFLNKVEDFANWLRQQPETLHVFSITDVIKRLNKNLHGEDPAWYGLPEARDMTAQYLLLYEMSLPFGLDLNDRLNVDKSATRLTATLKSLSTNEILAFEQRAREWLATNAPELRHAGGTGITMMFAHIGARNIVSMISGELLSTFLISFILMIVLRSAAMGLLSMIPNLVPAAMAFGIWGLWVGRVGLASSVVAAMTLGILVDDTVHFLGKYLHARRHEGLSPEDALRYAFASVGKAIWVTSAVLMSGFALLALSDFKINAEMGLLTAIIFGLGLFAEFLLLPPLLLAVEGWRLRVRPSKSAATRRATAPAYIKNEAEPVGARSYQAKTLAEATEK
ncbi:amino acid adenylation domain-containing protein [Methylomicrobium lacus]|uniref:amino acid adenylation domain-containing protein n=1 Tax=Methylomicrobium lacus TaxID=136992 RepID=UPI0035A9A57F